MKNQTLYLVRWLADGTITVIDHWNLEAIKHRDEKEGSSSIEILRPATEEDITKYGSLVRVARKE